MISELKFDGGLRFDSPSLPIFLQYNMDGGHEGIKCSTLQPKN